ncbi:MAG: ATP-binding protein, partial [Bacilli bacterium]|nr:ATP-binding protein [Bacilli bacterium]
MKSQYLPRLFDETLKFSLKSKGAVVIVGPKWCGKSTTALRHAKSVIDLMPISKRAEWIALAKISPEEFLSRGEHPLLIDEWQHVYFLWDQIKYEVDRLGGFGHYILTGSVTADFERQDDGIRHTGNGRIVKKRMRTLSLFESKESNGKVSLSDLKEGKFAPCTSSMGIHDYAFALCRGGWPMAIAREKDVAFSQAKDYFEMLVSEDIFSFKGIPLRKDEQRARQFMRSYARNVSIPAADETLREDCSSVDGSFDKDTFQKYLSALRCLYVVEELPAWNPNLRSKTAIRSKPTRHFVDPSIATSALGITPKSLFDDITTFGLLFESLAIRDLRIYAESIGARVYKYRDAKSREADAVVCFPDGGFALIEVKLGGEEEIALASKKLCAIANDID